jgi:hypothetical protein
MNILHVNAHAALYHDVRDVMTRLGHRVYSWCVSRHLWVTGQEPVMTAVLALQGWEHINAEFCQRVQRDFGPQFSAFDAIIVDHPIAFAGLFEQAGRPVIANATTRYDVACDQTPEGRRWLDDTLIRMFDRGQLLPMSNNLGDRAYGRERLGFDWPLVPSLCEYPRAPYTGGRPQWLRASLGHPPLPQPYAWRDLADYRGIVHVPYNCSQMALSEQYAAAIPIVVPSDHRLLEMALEGADGAMAQVSGLRVRGLAPGRGWDAYQSAESLERWIAHADWNDDHWMPGVLKSADFNDPSFLASIDVQAVSARVKAFLPARRSRILKAWESVLERAARL